MPENIPKDDLIGNTFPVHNNYVDHILHLLYGDEVKILLYAIRRIKGFQKEQDHISLSQFTTGTKSRVDGRALDHGTGLSRQAACDALRSLKQFGLLVEVLPNNQLDKKGSCYTLQYSYDKIDIAGLEQRATEKLSRESARTEKARHSKKMKPDSIDRSVRQTDQVDRSVCLTDQSSVCVADRSIQKIGLSDRPGSVCLTDQRSVCQTDSQYTEENQKENQKKKGDQPTAVAPRPSDFPGTSQPIKKVKVIDPRSSHPAIQTVRELINRYPDKSIWDDIIRVLGDKPDTARLFECFKEWAKRSSNAGNLAVWLFDWYANRTTPTNVSNFRLKVNDYSPTTGTGKNMRLRVSG